MSKGGDNREQRAKIREAERDGQSASEAGLSTGANKQIGHGQQTTPEELHREKGKT
ncbi:MAG: hypothetical protein M3P53_13100 [Actinomycetota bacterium]|nr:hypothetical protein [Actinomycetota bacterium]